MHAERDSKGLGAEALRGEGLVRKGAPWGHSCQCFPWLPPLLSKDLLMVSVRDGRPCFTPLTTIITARLEAIIAAAMEKSCQNTIKFQSTAREREQRKRWTAATSHCWVNLTKNRKEKHENRYFTLGGFGRGLYRRVIWAAQAIGLLKT